MQQSTGNFVKLIDSTPAEASHQMADLQAQIAKVNPQYDVAKASKPTLEIGEVVDIKGVKFRVTRIKRDGKVGLKMLALP